VPSLKDLIQDGPIHSRILDFKTYPLDEERVIVAGKLKDERFLPFYNEAGRLAKEGVIHEMLLYLLIGGVPLIILEADAEMPQVPRDLCAETRESIRRIVGLEIKSGFSENVEGCAHLTHLLVVMVQAALHGYWAHKMSKPRPVPRSLNEIDGLPYLVNSCRLWREDGPIVQELKEMIEESNRTRVEP
jgi:Protein of unknown function (DUF2889)